MNICMVIVYVAFQLPTQTKSAEVRFRGAPGPRARLGRMDCTAGDGADPGVVGGDRVGEQHGVAGAEEGCLLCERHRPPRYHPGTPLPFPRYPLAANLVIDLPRYHPGTPLP
eukprot:2425236-Rhodomonas_salina.2